MLRHNGKFFMARWMGITGYACFRQFVPERSFERKQRGGHANDSLEN